MMAETGLITIADFTRGKYIAMIPPCPLIKAGGFYVASEKLSALD